MTQERNDAMTQTKKPPADLTVVPPLVTVKGQATVPADAPQQRIPPSPPAAAGPAAETDGRQQQPKPVPLNFRVSPDFKRRFRLYAAERNMKLIDVLIEAFDALESKK